MQEALVHISLQTCSLRALLCLRQPFQLLILSLSYRKQERMISKKILSSSTIPFKLIPMLKTWLSPRSLDWRNWTIRKTRRRLLPSCKTSPRSRPINLAHQLSIFFRIIQTSTKRSQILQLRTRRMRQNWLLDKTSQRRLTRTIILPATSRWFRVRLRSKILTSTLKQKKRRRTSKQLWLLCRISQKKRLEIRPIITFTFCEQRKK